MLWWVLVDRELRAAARRAGTWWWRVGGALALCVGALMPALPLLYDAPPAFQGEVLFTALIIPLWFSCWMAGMVLTADSLARERREGTLGLLFLTDLSPATVVAGKLASGSLQALGAVVAALPLLTLPILLGGVSPGQWSRAALVCLLTLWVSLNVGLFCSALNLRVVSALGWTFVVLVILSAIIPMVVGVSLGFLDWHALDFLPAVWTPAGGLFLIGDTAYRSGPGWFWAWAAVQFALGLCAFTGTRMLVDRLWRETDAPARLGTIRKWRAALHQWMRIRNPAERAVWLDRAPYAWRLLRTRGDRWMPWSVLGSMVLLWIWIAWRWEWTVGATWVFLFVGGALVRAVILSQTISVLAEDRREGGAELVATSPQGPEGLWKAHWLALRRLWLWPLLLFTLASCLMGWGLAQRGTSISPHFATSLVLVWADVAALVSAGTWMALSGRSALLSMVLTAGLVWGIPWALMSAAGAVLFVADLMFRSIGQGVGDWVWSPWIYFGMRLGLDLLVGGFAWHQLCRRFRTSLG
ncbi:MAG: ABC transporter permease [Limisphaera sp.]|nr:ABC transporter permease [Limisphaera sp.]